MAEQVAGTPSRTGNLSVRNLLRKFVEEKSDKESENVEGSFDGDCILEDML